VNELVESIRSKLPEASIGIFSPEIRSEKDCSVFGIDPTRFSHCTVVMGLPDLITGLVSRILTPFILFTCEVIYYVTQPIWLWLPPVVQVLYLIAKRTLLREKNITAPTLPSPSAMRESGVPSDARTFEGSHNNSEKPTMGMTDVHSLGTPHPQQAGEAER